MITVALLAVAGAAVLIRASGEAHTPVTSPYTYSEHVLPILDAHCAQCHVSGGVGPMSLMTHADAVPWAESMRVELMAGHMPPWPVEAPRGRFQHTQGLSAKELNVLMTWASGGTPAGPALDPAVGTADTPRNAQPRETPPLAPRPGWPLGAPDHTIELPSYSLDERTTEATATFSVPASTNTAADTAAKGSPAERWLRAVDLRPGTPSVVRGATVTVQTSADTQTGADARSDVRSTDDGTSREQTVAVWLPGDTPVPFPSGAAIRVPPGASLTVAVRYKKTWAFERMTIEDRSVLGLYFADGPSADVRAVHLTPSPGTLAPVDPAQPLTFSVDIASDAHVLAVYPDARLAGVRATIDAVRPDGSRTELLALGPQGGWPRRYWFAEPVLLTRGTRVVVRAQVDQSASVPGASARPPAALDLSTVRFTLNVAPLSR
jgi:hypothetical protein